MKSCGLLAISIILSASIPAQAAPDTSVPIGSEFLDVDFFVGTGSSTSYLVVDFLRSTSGPMDTYAFGYRYDGVRTPADALLELDTHAGFELDTTNFGGTLGLNIDRIAYGGDDDAPDFGADDRFWNFFQGDHQSATVNWAFSNDGISARTLTNGSFDGFLAKTFSETDEPRIPTGVPEPSAAGMMLLGILGSVFRDGFAYRTMAVRSRRWRKP